MKKYFKISILLFIYFSVISCTTLGILSEAGKKVKLTSNKNLIENCQFIDGFLSNSISGLDNLDTLIRGKAFKMGGDIVLVVWDNLNMYEVYRCSEQPPKIKENVQAEENQESVNSPE